MSSVNQLDKYQPYPDYKDSGIVRLGRIPTHWTIKKLKQVASIENGKDYKHVESEDGYPVIGSGGQFSFACQCLYNGESVLLGRKGTIDRPIYINGPFWTVDTMFYTKISKNFSAKYLYYAALTIEFNLYSTSTALPSMTQEDLGNIHFAIPSNDELITIAAFLDYETARIDQLIAKQKQLIELLKEKRQAVISHAVTKGLNPNAPMKDSGVEWLGQVPEHWDVSALKRFWFVVDCKHITAEFFDEGIPLASIREVQSWAVDLSDAKKTSEEYYKVLIEGNRLPEDGDIIFSRNATVGEAARVTMNHPPFAMGQDVCLLKKSIPSIDTDFFMHQLKSRVVSYQLDTLMVGSTFKRINVDDIRNFIVVMPPEEEAVEIRKYLNSMVSKYRRLEQTALDQVALLQERRTALISAAVTGKIDLRGWQPPKREVAA